MQERIEPQTNDILLGRGGRHFLHHGNLRLRKKTMELAPIYRALSKVDKAAMINNILGRLFQEDPPVRFLRCQRPLNETQYWEVVDESKSREKVGQYLREAVKRMRRQQDIRVVR